MGVFSPIRSMSLVFLALFIHGGLYSILSKPGIAANPISNENTLKLVHVIFRHGNRTPNGPEELYPKDPYLNETYYPLGLGQLTNAGKRREFYIGKALRDKYNTFLGPYYYPELVEPISTDYNRTKMSLELVLASLFPPKGVEIWNLILHWQPVPYNYLQRSEDKILQGVLCPNYVKLYNRHTQSRQVQAKFEENQNIFQYISKNTGLNVTTFRSVYNLQFGLRAEEDYGLKLPAWTEKVWPKNITELAIQEYFVATGTTELRRMASGYFLQKLIRDTNLNINGTNKERKLYLYSAHEDNIANLLIALDVFGTPHIPNYGAYLVFEVHRINGEYGIKIYYENYTAHKPQLLKLPACETFCKLEQFTSLVEEYIPTSNLCNQN